MLIYRGPLSNFLLSYNELTLSKKIHNQLASTGLWKLYSSLINLATKQEAY